MAEQDDGIQKLDAFVALVAETRGKLQELGDQVDGSIQELDKAEDDVEDKIGGFNDLVAEFTTTFETEFKFAVEALDSHDQVIADEGIKGLEEASNRFEAGEGDFEQSLGDARKSIGEDFEELATAGFDAFDQLLSTLSGEVDQIQQEAEAAFETFAKAVDGFEELTEGAEKETLEIFQNVASNVTETFTNKMDSVFTTIHSHLTESMVGQFEGDLGDLAGNLTEMFSDVGENVERLAGELIQNGGQILSDMASDVVQTFTQGVQDAVKSAIEEFVSELLKEITTSIVLMNVGASTTAALAPYIPQLAIAKGVVTVINDLLDALNPFD